MEYFHFIIIYTLNANSGKASYFPYVNTFKYMKLSFSETCRCQYFYSCFDIKTYSFDNICCY